MDPRNTFPTDVRDALTLLYLRGKNTSEMSPVEFVQLYWETYYRIVAAFPTAGEEAKVKVQSEL